MSNSSTSIFSTPFILAFFLPIILFVFGLSLYERMAHKLDHPFVRALLNAKSGKIECLIIGDSHTSDGFGENLPDCDVLALGGVTLPMIYDGLGSVLSNNPVKKIIIGFAPHQFSDKRLKIKSNTYRDISKWFNPYPNLIVMSPLIQRIIRDYQDHPLDLSVFFKFFPFPKKTPWSERTEQYQVRKSKASIVDHKISENVLDTTSFSALKKILKLIDKSKLQTCILNTPNLGVYYHGIRHYVPINEWNKVIDTIKNSSVNYVDYNLVEKIDTHYFKDPEHLNLNGSKIYASKMYQSCFP